MSENIRYALLFAAVVAVCVIMVAIIVVNASLPTGTRRIDCTWSEISPDFSPAMREACRKARNERAN